MVSISFVGVLSDQKRNDASVTEEEIDTEFNDSEFESGDRGSIAFTINSSIPTLNPLDSSSDDYRFASGTIDRSNSRCANRKVVNNLISTFFFVLSQPKVM